MSVEVEAYFCEARVARSYRPLPTQHTQLADSGSGCGQEGGRNLSDTAEVAEIPQAKYDGVEEVGVGEDVTEATHHVVTRLALSQTSIAHESDYTRSRSKLSRPQRVSGGGDSFVGARGVAG